MHYYQHSALRTMGFFQKKTDNCVITLPKLGQQLPSVKPIEQQ